MSLFRRVGRFAWRLVRETFSKWRSENVPRLGAALAYYAIFSLSPLLLMATAIAAMIFGEKVARAHTMEELETLMGPKGVSAISGLLDNATRPAPGTAAAVIGVLVVLWGASRIFTELRAALNHIWGVEREGQSAIKMAITDRLLSFLMVLGTGVVLICSLVAATALQTLTRKFGATIPYISHATTRLYPYISFGVILVMIAGIFKVLPATKVRWRDVLVGAALTSMMFGLGRYVIAYYLSRTTAISVYGAAGSLVVLLWWIYYSAQILLIGAVFTCVWGEYFTSRREAADREPGGDI
jgi:membrane protein